eukprot:CAMPEP_0184310626 /NCGR_PEP_ID=MMETSP1049-20130417/32259_1 /TAXON_ID=77928 /ORGANISM="Proteomonas sulcata, Strain CCMP704" /LENGTH=35 /DNA_ID= /DNA_START= /DNA_END= /DNA_ORIENTATION=
MAALRLGDWVLVEGLQNAKELNAKDSQPQTPNPKP